MQISNDDIDFDNVYSDAEDDLTRFDEVPYADRDSADLVPTNNQELTPRSVRSSSPKIHSNEVEVDLASLEGCVISSDDELSIPDVSSHVVSNLDNTSYLRYVYIIKDFRLSYRLKPYVSLYGEHDSKHGHMQ